jgi:hypothetical protein
MEFDSTIYGPEVARILAVDGDGMRLAPLVCGSPNAEAHKKLTGADPKGLFGGSKHSKSAMVGLWLYHSCFEEAHQLADSLKTTEGLLWHAIIHRQEPDSGNAAYWFRRAGPHPIFPRLAREAIQITDRYPGAEFRVGVWDPYSYIAFHERAQSQPGTEQEQAAREIQRLEWQLLFDHCAKGASH